jgi:lipopolysaccharide/colanic/teichoic acid biosynthesis glycosyltransferase
MSVKLASNHRLLRSVPRDSNRRPAFGDRVSQRYFDIVVSVLLLIAASPLLLMAILAIKLENPRASAFFRQTRYGYRGVPFSMMKLRTMVPNAEQLKAKYAALSEDQGPGFKIDNDPRITRVGRVLRKLYIDELPQLVNVLQGDMSIVGPRANSFNPSTYKPWQRIRLAVKPGITGPWQIARVKPKSFDDRCRMDMEYLATKSLRNDVRTIIATVIMLLTRPSGT